MCNYESEGNRFGCGHYVKTRNTNKIDCMRPDCALSVRHPRGCSSPQCNQHYGPDRAERILAQFEQWCQSCQWFIEKHEERRLRAGNR
ncbi:hypothetical protein V5O48_005317 [Marasmius crinis-equi]|uniref:Uncharacterized protein n=1 Tax=Marasmius crinis-equi TaxID=585013 RepID=A0ABR3FMK8_9AGAR